MKATRHSIEQNQAMHIATPDEIRTAEDTSCPNEELTSRLVSLLVTAQLRDVCLLDLLHKRYEQTARPKQTTEG